MRDLVLDREAAIEALVRAGVPRAKAEARFPATVELRRSQDLEKVEQREVVRLYRAFGCVVRSLSQPRATKQSPGFPDLWIVHTRIGQAWWHETKRQGWTDADVRPDQRVFREDCLACGIDYVLGDRFAAAEQLVRLGLAVRVGDRLEPASRTLRGGQWGSHG
ncbi:MAG: hypothetical protein QJR03_15840 [Sphaerobacter sp.]|nr:hypothetical protein [Sphaerobacter sp.]